MIEITINDRLIKIHNKIIFTSLGLFCLLGVGWVIHTVSYSIDVTGMHRLLYIGLSLLGTFFIWLPNMFPELFS